LSPGGFGPSIAAVSAVETVEERPGPRIAEAPRAPRRRLKPAFRRAEILVAAARAMRRRGAATTIEDVAHEAGAARGTVYLYFPTWERLVLDLRGLVLAEFGRRAAALIGTAPADGDWPRRAGRLTSAFADFLVGLGGLREGLFQAPGVPRLSRDVTAPITALLRAGVEAGELAADDPESTARLICAAAQATADAIAAGEPRDRALAALTDLVRRAIAR